MTTVSTLKAQIVADASGLVDGLNLTTREIRSAAKVARDAMTDFERFDAERLRVTQFVAGGHLSPDAAARHLEKFLPTATLVPQLSDFASKANLTADAASRLSVEVGGLQRSMGALPLVFDPVNAALQAGRIGWDMLSSAISTTAGVIEDRIAAIDRLGDEADRLGVSESSLSRLQVAAQLGDVDPESVSAMLEKLLVNVGKGAEVFGDLGLDVEKLKAMAPDRMFEAVADAITKLPNGAEKFAAMQEAMGKSSPDAATLVQNLGDLMRQADETGAVVGDGLASQVGEADDAMTRLSLSTQGFGNALASISAGPLTEVLDAVTQLSKTQFFERLFGFGAGVAADRFGLPGAALGGMLSQSLVDKRAELAADAKATAKTVADALKDVEPPEEKTWFDEAFWARVDKERDARFKKNMDAEAREEERRMKERADEEKRIRGEKWADEMRKIDEAQKVIEGLKLPSEKIEDKLSEDLAALELAGMDTPERRDALIRRAAGELSKSAGEGGFGAPGADKGTRAAREAVINAQKQDEANKRLRDIAERLRKIHDKPELRFVKVTE